MQRNAMLPSPGDTTYTRHEGCSAIAMKLLAALWVVLAHVLGCADVLHAGHQPLSRIAIERATAALDESAGISAHPTVLGLKGQSSDWVVVEFWHPNPSNDDWVGVFSPSGFSSETCQPENWMDRPPYLCTAPIKFQYANHTNGAYNKSGKGSLRLQLINQRADFAFALFSGGFSAPKLVAVSNNVTFQNPKAPVYPRLAQGKSWNEMTVTWTSGYSVKEAVPFVEWGPEGGDPTLSPAGTLTFGRNSMCGSPARTVGWRDPGYIHTSFLKELWPDALYTYRLGHRLPDGTRIWSSKSYSFRASPFPGQESLQRVVVFGDMGKAEVDGSDEYGSYEQASLNTTEQIVKDLDNVDMVIHIGDLSYANGYLSQWDQFTQQIEPIASAVPYMIGIGNHERDWPDTGSFYGYNDSGGECGVPAQTMFYVPAENRAKSWYSTDYGMFRFCIANTEEDWRPGTEQYKFIEHCLSSVDRHKQPWLIFLAHRVLGYSSAGWYETMMGSYGEPMGREGLQDLWQRYKVDLAVFGHIHGYERTCPIYQNRCVQDGSSHYSGRFNATTHVTVGGGGASLSTFRDNVPYWSFVRDADFGFGKLTAINSSFLLFEYKKSSDGDVYDRFTRLVRCSLLRLQSGCGCGFYSILSLRIASTTVFCSRNSAASYQPNNLTVSRDYRDLMACSIDSCPRSTLAV